jgi:hypothetical protein
MFMVGMLSGDVAIFIVLLGLPLAMPIEAMAVNMAYGALMIVIVAIVMAKLFHLSRSDS